MSEAGRAWVLRTRLLFMLAAAIWTAVGVGTLTGMISTGSAPAWVAGMIGGLSLVNAVLLVLLGCTTLRGWNVVDYVAVAVVVVNIVTTITDEVGAADLVYLLLVVALLVSLLRGMKAVREGTAPKADT